MPCAEPELERAVAALGEGRLVAFPTETVWGIAADARQPAAVERLSRFKGRDPAQPISVLVAEPGELEPLGCVVDAVARALIDAFWPGPLTLVLPVAPERRGPAARLANPDGGLGVRCSPHPVARALARAAAAAGIGPLTATSCNRAGEPPARTRAQARRVCTADAGSVRGSGAADVPLVLEAGEDASGEAPSTVVDCGTRPVRVLRAGAVSAEAIREVLAAVPEADAGPGTARDA